ncbi:MAG: hypothetical protein Q9203_003211 [Teloschistes exilis]
MSTTMGYQNLANTPKKPQNDGSSNICVEKGRLSYRNNPGDQWTDVDDSFRLESVKENEEPWNVQNVVFSAREYLPGDQPSVPAPETFPLALIAYNEINAFVGCEIRLDFRRFNWKSKDLPDTWMWPAIDGFLGVRIQYRWNPERKGKYTANLADGANSKKKYTAELCPMNHKDESGKEQWQVVRRVRCSHQLLKLPTSSRQSRGLSGRSTTQEEEVRPEDSAVRDGAIEDKHTKRKREEREGALATQSRTATSGHTSDAIYARRKNYLNGLESLRLKQKASEEELRLVRRKKGELFCFIEDADEELAKK